MAFSRLSEIKSSRDVTSAFGGYNHNVMIGDSDFFDMKNLTSMYYPTLSPRNKRSLYNYPASDQVVTHKINGVIYKDAVCYVDGTHLYINNYRIDTLTLSDTPKQLISMGAYIIIMPDKKFINTKDLTEYGSIEAEFKSTTTVSFEMCKADGTVYEDIEISDTAPENPSNLDLWIDTSNKPHILKQYSDTNSMWSPIATTYIKISSPNIAQEFKQYDAVKISGISEDNDELKDLNDKASVLWEVNKSDDGSDDYIVIQGILDEVYTQDTEITFTRKMPKMDFIIESNNRLWGCRYGTNNAGEVVNEIYASKLGDFKNWECYMGTSTDSYAASCGSDGAWNGAINHLGYPLFFKENCLHKVYGNYPSNYQIQSTPCRGVMKGGGNSLAIVNETLFYKGRNGVCAYDGSLPSEISAVFGGIRYDGVDESNTDVLRNGAAGGSVGNKYYISMKSETDSTWHMFAFDTSLGLWHKEDNERADLFENCGGILHFIRHSDKALILVNGSDNPCESTIEWMAESGVMGTSIKKSNKSSASLPERKYISQINIRMALEIGTKIDFFIQYDSMGEFEHIYSVTGTSLKSYFVPIRPKRCDHFRIRIVGSGNAKIYSLTKNIELGSEF